MLHFGGRGNLGEALTLTCISRLDPWTLTTLKSGLRADSEGSSDLEMPSELSDILSRQALCRKYRYSKRYNVYNLETTRSRERLSLVRLLLK